MSRGYEIKPAGNGGFIVVNHHTHPGYTPEILGAFSNAKDLIVWLANSHEVSISINETVPSTDTDSVYEERGILVLDGGPLDPATLEIMRRQNEQRRS